MSKGVYVVVILILCIAFSFAVIFFGPDETGDEFYHAKLNGIQANEAFLRSNRVLLAWMGKMTKQHLFPREVKGENQVWEVKDTAADLYPYLILSAYYTNKTLLGDLRETLEVEKALSGGGLPVSFDLNNGRTVNQNEGELIFGASEYVKDGLMPVTEVMGKNEWYERMLYTEEIIFQKSSVKTEYGPIPSNLSEVNGNQLQVLPRLYMATNDSRYLKQAETIGDVYVYEILPKNGYTPCREWSFSKNKCISKARFNDHGNEIIPGLVELYNVESIINSSRRAVYNESIKKMLDATLEYRNGDGLFYVSIDRSELSDTWGYVYNAYYLYHLIENESVYYGEIMRTLENVRGYEGYKWDPTGADGYADTVESALYLVSVMPHEQNAVSFIDETIQVMFDCQKDDGFVDYVYWDGNFIRTSLMYALYKTQGVYVDAFRPDVLVGGYRVNQTLYVYLESGMEWEGKLKFDYERHKKIMGMPYNYPRLNAFPEWYTIRDDAYYNITFVDENRSNTILGSELIGGIRLEVDGEKKLIVQPLDLDYGGA